MAHPGVLRHLVFSARNAAEHPDLADTIPRKRHLACETGTTWKTGPCRWLISSFNSRSIVLRPPLGAEVQVYRAIFQAPGERKHITKSSR
jgi:hypothetical protein